MKVLTGKGMAVVAAALVAALLALGGCAGSGGQSSSASSSAPAQEVSSSTAEAEPEADAAASTDVSFGDEADGAAVVVLANETGSAIGGVSVAVAGSGAEPVALASGDAAWEPGETAAIYLGSEDAAAYDVTLSIDGAAYVLHGVDAGEFEEADVRLDGSVAYLTYELDGSPVSTLDDEAAIAAEEQAAAEAAAAEAAAAEAAAAEAAAAESYSYDGTSSAQPAQSEDSCVDGGVVLR